MSRFPLSHLGKATLAAGALSCAIATPALAQYRQKIGNDLSQCQAGKGPAVMVTVSSIKSSSGKVRVQLYNGTKQDWLVGGRWLSRIELPARAGTMTFCLPVPKPGTYGVAVRHDLNGNGKTDLSEDGGAMSNNPSINLFNLGKPSYSKTAFQAGSGVTSIAVQMRYL